MQIYTGVEGVAELEKNEYVIPEPECQGTLWKAPAIETKGEES